MVRSLFFATAVAGVDGAVIETRPHQNIQSAQLQNATDAVIRTAAVAGLAYAGAYLAGAQGSHESNTVSDSARQATNFFSSTGQALCSTGETNPENFHCTASRFNGHSHSFPNVEADKQAVLPVRNYWCCPNQALGGAAYQGKLDGVCSAGVDLDVSACVYHGPCAPAEIKGTVNAPGKCTGSATSGTDASDFGIIGSSQDSNTYGQGGEARNFAKDAKFASGNPDPAIQHCCVHVPKSTFKNEDGEEIGAFDAAAILEWKTPISYSANHDETTPRVVKVGDTVIGATFGDTAVPYDPSAGSTEQVLSFCSQTADVGTYVSAEEKGNYIKCFEHTA